MQAIVSSGLCRDARLDLSFEDFLDSGHMHGRARAAMCSPEELIVDYLPPFDIADPAEMREAFGEACYQITDGDVDKIRFDEEDMRFIRNRFLRARRFRLLPPLPLEAA